MRRDADTPARSLGGRFTESTHPVLERINRSVDVDRRLWKQDVAGSRAHARMLAQVGLLAEGEVTAILEGLDVVADELAHDRFPWSPFDEDVHMAVERRLGELIGAPAGKLHTGRSRNDQVALDTILWLREALTALRGELVSFGRTLVARAEQGILTPMPSFTHLQPAQVSSVAQWLLAHAVEVERNLRRLDDLRARLDECPLGAGASAGSYLPLDRDATAQALGFRRPTLNGVQTTGSRSDLLDAIGVLSVIGVTLSRLGEELVLLASPSFGWIRLPDALTTGSSLLPQKRNPDGAELMRATGKLPAADFAGLASVCAGLFSGYSKDLQHDKAVLFRAVDAVRDAVALATLHAEALAWDAPRMRAACTPDLAALWLADRLVLAGMPFRQGHHLVGAVVRAAAESGGTLADALAALDAEIPQRDEIVAELARLTPEALLAGLRSAGGAGPTSTRAQIRKLKVRFAA